MTSGTFQYALLAALAGLLITAAVTDWRRREIDNWLNLTIACMAPLFWLATGIEPWPGMAIQFGLGLLILGIFSIFLMLNAMGGGDVKLLAALALWFAPVPFVRLLIEMSLFGGALTIIMLIRQKALKLLGKPEIPYGIAIVFAGLLSIYERYLNHFGQ